MILEFNRTRECTRRKKSIMPATAPGRFGPQSAVIVRSTLRRMTEPHISTRLRALVSLLERAAAEQDKAQLVEEAKKEALKLAVDMGLPMMLRVNQASAEPRPAMLTGEESKWVAAIRKELRDREVLQISEFVARNSIVQPELGNLRRSLSQASKTRVPADERLVYDKASGAVRLFRRPAKVS